MPAVGRNSLFPRESLELKSRELTTLCGNVSMGRDDSTSSPPGDLCIALEESFLEAPRLPLKNLPSVWARPTLLRNQDQPLSTTPFCSPSLAHTILPACSDSSISFPPSEQPWRPTHVPHNLRISPQYFLAEGLCCPFGVCSAHFCNNCVKAREE